jgi:hypothetical protein
MEMELATDIDMLMLLQQQGLNSECDGMVWRVDVGMSSGVLNAMPQVRCSQPCHTLQHSLYTSQNVMRAWPAEGPSSLQPCCFRWLVRTLSTLDCCDTLMLVSRLQALEIGAKEGSREPDIRVLGDACGPQLPDMARGNPFLARSFGSIGAISRL